MNALFRSLKTVSFIFLSTVLIGLIGDEQGPQGHSYFFLSLLDRYEYKSTKIPVIQAMHMVYTESVATLPPFSPIEGQKWFDQISSQWESQKNRFALTYIGKIQFWPPCIWNLPFMSTASEEVAEHHWASVATVVGSIPRPLTQWNLRGGCVE